MRTRLAITLVALAICVASCSSKKQLDTAAEKLIKVYAEGDYEGFKSLVHPDIVKQISEERFRYTAKALNDLGPPTDRSMSGISVKSGAPSEGTYSLTYKQGKVSFKLKVLDGIIVGFNLEGDVLTRALQKAASAEFKVSAFTFLTAPGKEPRVDSTFVQGEKIAFRMQVMGLAEQERNVHMRLTLTILSPDGKPLFEKVLLDEPTKLAEGALPIANPTGSLDAGVPGAYRLRFTVDDVLGKKQQVVDQDITVVET